MNNFEFQNPTKIIFGKGEIAKIAHEIPSDKNVLIIYGGGSIKKNGVYDQIMAALKEHHVAEFSGIEPNPNDTTCFKAVRQIHDQDIDFLLAIGGGSVIDATKFIAAAAAAGDADPRSLLGTIEVASRALPFGVVLTLPATGSEMNPAAIITNTSTHEKTVFKSQHVFPQFSVLDPTVTFTLPPRQVANGVVDAFTHVMEQYLTYSVNHKLQERFAESILLTLVEEGPKTLANPTDYDARANMMWCCTMALNGLIRYGVPNDWATHMIGHTLTALHGLDHAQTLAIILPTIMEYKRDKKRDRILQYAERIWNITEGSQEERIDAAISKTREFFESLGVKTHLRDYDINEDDIPKLIGQLRDQNLTALGEHKDITLEDSQAILEESL